MRKNQYLIISTLIRCLFLSVIITLYFSLASFAEDEKDYYDKAIETNPKNADAYLNRGTYYQNLNNNQQAIEDFTKAIEIDPKLEKAYVSRAYSQYILNNFQLALDDFTKAIVINPKNANAYHMRGHCYHKLGNDDNGIDDMKTAARLGDTTAQDFLNKYGIPWQ